jgi:hypothetical protein
MRYFCRVIWNDLLYRFASTRQVLTRNTTIKIKFDLLYFSVRLFLRKETYLFTPCVQAYGVLFILLTMARENDMERAKLQ